MNISKVTKRVEVDYTGGSPKGKTSEGLNISSKERIKICHYFSPERKAFIFWISEHNSMHAYTNVFCLTLSS